MYTLKQVLAAVDNVTALGGDKEVVNNSLTAAIQNLNDALDGMDRLQVGGRFHLDTLLGCMMAVEQIIGEENNG